MAINRQNIIRGPGIIRLGDNTAPWINPMDDWTAEVDLKTFDLSTNLSGPFDIRKDDQVAKISFTPLDTPTWTQFYPEIFRHPDIGGSIFGSADRPCLCHSKAGKLVTFHCAALTKPPDLILSANKARLGRAEITAIMKNGFTPAAENALYTISDAAMPAFAIDVGEVKTQAAVSAEWGAAFPTIITESGWTITVEPDIEFVQIDDAGTVDGLLKSVRVTAKCTPVNLTETQILDAMKLQNYPRGGSLQPALGGANDLYIDYGGNNFELYRAGLMRGPLQYGSVKLRAGELAWVGAFDSSLGSLFEVTA